LFWPVLLFGEFVFHECRSDELESVSISLGRGGRMSIGALSASGLSQYVLDSSNLTQTQQTWQTLQQSLSTGNISAAQKAFNSYQQLTKNLTQISGSSSASTQLTTDMTALGKALTAGDLSAAQSAFATVQKDMTNSTSQAMANATAAMTQVEGWVSDLLSSANTSSTSSTSSDPTSSLLESALNPDTSSSSSDPVTAALESFYGVSGSTSLNLYA
jgi:hypothetical protein